MSHTPAFAISLVSSLVFALTLCVAKAAEDEVGFAQDIKPILARRCFSCHGPETAEGGLALHDEELALAELDSGALGIVPGEKATSELIRRITSEDEHERMPPAGKPLTMQEIDSIGRWIDQGAKWQQHWSFEPVGDPTPPETRIANWVRNDVDRFIAAKLDDHELTPSKPASKVTLVRRLYYDLIGLPPTSNQLAEYLADERVDAYERLVDKLLASPHYGERWARHWLDVVRYGETNSFERDTAKPEAWKFRDYVIRSLNEDKPFAEFVREQLAGDELDEVTVESMTATGYYRIGAWDDDAADKVQGMADEMDDLVSTTSQAFLGLTIGCARCHDHKIDPIPQADYYGMVAFFGDVTSYGNRRNHLWDTTPPALRERREELDSQVRQTEQEKRELEQIVIERMPGVLQRLTEGHERSRVLEEQLSKHFRDEEQDRYDAISERLRAVRDELDSLPPIESVLAMVRANPRPGSTHINERGNPRALGDEVQPHFLTIFGGHAPEFHELAADATSAGRRRVLADWIASPDNPLTSRVIANRVWQHHFGRGIVQTPNNFGQLGVPPTHPRLLDYLASYLVKHDWRLKPLHRLIVTSAAYRMSSTANDKALTLDPANDLFWRFDTRRLSAEEVRDSVLAVAGNLNRELYGPSIYPTLSSEVLATQSRPGDGWGDSSDTERARRSVYIHVKRSLLVPLLTAFDLPDPDSSCEARFNTTQPAQAFSLLHSNFFHEEAGYLARRVEQHAGSNPREQVVQTLRLVLGREATSQEVEEGLALLNRLQSEHGKDEQEALRHYCLTTLNFSEFVYLD